MATDLTFNIAALDRASDTFVKLAAKVDKIGDRLDALDRKKADPKVDVDTTLANAKLDDLNKKIGALDKLNLRQKDFIGLGAFLGAGPAIAGGLLAIPAAITAISVAAEKSNPVVAASFASLKQEAVSTAQEGLAPLAPAFARFEDEATSALGAVKPELAAAANATAPLIQIVGADFIKATEQGIGASVPIIQSLRPAAQAIGDDFVKVEQGVAGFLDNLDVGEASKGLEALGSDVENMLPPIGTLLSNVVPLGNAFLNVLGPALTNTVDVADRLTPVLSAAGSAISFLGPDIATYTPPALAALAATKLLTGSWTDFSGAIAKVKPLVTDTSSVVGALGQKLGYTSAAANQAKAAQAAEAVVTAELTKAADEEAVALAQAAFAADASAANALKLNAAQAAAKVSAEAAATAERALAATSEAATFSFGPLGIALGAVAALALPFIGSTDKASASTQDLSQQLIQLGTATPSAAASLISQDKDLQNIAGDLRAVGSSAAEFGQAYSGSLSKAQTYTDGLIKAQTDLGNKMIGVSQDQSHAYEVSNLAQAQSVTSVKELADEVNRGDVSYSMLTGTLKEQVDEYNHYNNVVPQAKSALQTLREEQQAEINVLQANGIQISKQQQQWVAFGDSLNGVVSAYNEQTAGIKGITDHLVAADSAFFTAQQNFQQLDQAVVQAGQSYQQAQAGIDSARHSLAQSSQAVSDAQHSEKQAADQVVAAQQAVKQAVQGVTNAEQQVAQAKRASLTAEQALTQARKDAAQQLADLKRQVTDQGDSEAEARLRVLDAQTAVNQAGLQGRSLASLGPLTTANESQFQLLLQLQEAQHNLNDVTAQGNQLRQQNASAQAAGVNGSQQVIAAQQQVTQAQQQGKQAAQSLAQAQAGVKQASQGVKDAQYAESQAHIATENAVYAEHQAQQQLNSAKTAASVALAALKVAKDNDSRSTDLNSAAGVRNFQTVEQLFEANFTATGDINLATQATEAQGKAMGIGKKAIDSVITSLTKVPKTTPFAIVGTPSLNLTSLIQQSSAEGISPYTLGLPKSQVANALAQARGGAYATGGYAAGGLVSGPGTGTSDSIVAVGDHGMLRVSDGEYIVKAAQTRKHLPLLQAINEDSLGYASGGVVDSKSLLGLNYRLAAWDGFLQGVSNVMHVFGMNTPNLPKGNGKVDLGALAVPVVSGTAAAAGLRGSRAANEAIVQRVWASMFGWTGAEWAATIPLLMQESGFNNVAQNPTSTAYGMFQFLNSTWAGYGIPKTSDPQLQAVAGGRYIKARYGDPIHALAHEHAFNWYAGGGVVGAKPPKVYDQGGWLGPNDMGRNLTGRPEAVLSPEESAAFVQIVKQFNAGTGKAPIEVHVHQAPGASVDAVAAEVMRRLEFAGR